MQQSQRRPYLLCLLVCCAAIPSVGKTQDSKVLQSQHEKSSPDEDFSRCLPAGDIAVDVMAWQTSARMDYLAEKMQTSIKKHQKWFMAQLKDVKPGQSLPYNTKLGLTAAEYKEFLTTAMKKTRLKKASQATLVIQEQGSKRVFTDASDLPYFAGIEVDFASRTVKTPFGTLSMMQQIKATPSQETVGMWNGVQWRQDKTTNQSSLSQLTSTIIEFSIGRLAKSGRGYLNYQVIQIEHGKPKIDFQYILNYDLPAPTTEQR